ncbi:Bud-site selection protein [Thelonectria olida]|uniref:Bud-site selection protein n=1 Tax=Thelonectria olida TaxID=1576542 RepID=A0A9P8WCU9_9HYPO|nr:Bud-site selection protein [Thelonectria olida]
MPKRKRSGEISPQDRLNKLSDDISRALKTAKGFERQRLSKRIHDDGITLDKKERLDREITVLKSLDLHQTARAHMYSSLLKIKPIAEHPDLPEEIRRGLAKPDLSEEEHAALHNVTSGLYNRDPVKQAVDRAVKAVCQMLDIPIPAKGKRLRKSKQEEKPESKDKIEGAANDDEADVAENEDVVESVEEDEDQGETDFEGFSDDEAAIPEAPDSEGEDAEEEEFSKYDHLLGNESDSDSEDFDDERFAPFKGKETPNLDDISLSGSAAASDSDSEAGAQQDSSPSASPSPPPAKKKKKDKSSASSARPSGSTFLPSLMGGYISGSESASDVDVEPAKKRRGQRARQAIWEKKFGAKAKHLQQPAKSKRGRDSGWDMKRGAVDGGDAETRTPWKKGVRNPLARQGSGASAHNAEAKRPPPKKDDEGPLHPSWEAKKKAKDTEKVAFAGSKITFD